MGLSNFAKTLRTTKGANEKSEKSNTPKSGALLRRWSQLPGDGPIDDAIEALDDEDESDEDDEHDQVGRRVEDATADAIKRSERTEPVQVANIREANARAAANYVPMRRIPFGNGAARFVFGRRTKH